MSTKKAQVKEHFKNYPEIEKIFVTADDQAFFAWNDARNHGNTLKDTQVTEVTRKDVTENVQEDLASKVAYVDHKDVDTIETLSENENVRVRVVDTPEAFERAQREARGETLTTEEGVKTTAEQEKIIEDAKDGANAEMPATKPDATVLDAAARAITKSTGKAATSKAATSKAATSKADVYPKSPRAKSKRQ